MPITDYTTYSDIRAALGVEVDELADATLALDIYLLGLQADFEDIDVSLLEDFETVAAISPASSRTDEERRFYDAVKLFAPYSVAVQLSAGLPLFAPKSITDGKAGVTRDSNSPYKDTIAGCLVHYHRARERLDARYAEYANASETEVFRPLLGVMSPSSDPVTGT